ncbi:MAG: adenylosuccinate synthase [Acidobacteria bacterium]|nr:adenylosuccinate synthase [Acidobacteriota bacterium]
MSNIVIVGSQWGDEGKGKIVDLVTERFDVVARYQGGHNAGHTVSIQGKKYILHLIPSGILHPGKLCVIGNGVVLDPFAFQEELKTLQNSGISIQNRVFVSNRAHLIMPYHRAIDAAEEQRRGAEKIGTTARGIGPCYEDKMARRGIRVADLFFPDLLRAKVRANVEFKNRLFKHIYQLPPMDADEISDTYLAQAQALAAFVTDTAEFLSRIIHEGRSILFEGAQGTLLDVDHGTYPFVTSSNATAGGACTGTGVGPRHIDGVIGIAKAYTTRVGGGPFPTELHDPVGRHIQQKGTEFGSSTGRPRRCGWFDAVVVRYATLINQVDTLVITKLDVLDELDEIQICVGYRYRGRVLDCFPTEISVLDEVEPVCEKWPGWKTDTSRIHHYEELPRQAREYLDRISQLIGTDISIISTGPNRAETIVLEQSPRLQQWFSPQS